MKKLLIIGGGGHAKSLIDNVFSTNMYKPIGILDEKKKVGEKVLGIPVIGNDDLLSKLVLEGIKNVAIGLGSSGDNTLRKKVFSKAKKFGYEVPSILHQKACISEFAKIKDGVQIFANSVVNANTVIDENSVINTSNVIEHDCFIGKNIFTGPGVVICGNVNVQENVFIGSNSTLTPNLIIKKNIFVAAHSLISKNLQGNEIDK